MSQLKSGGSGLVSNAHPRGDAVRGTLGPVDGAGREATVNACGVAVAMLQGHSWAPRPSNGSRVNVGTIPAVPLTGQLPAGRQEGPSPADAAGMGRRTRSSRGSGKPATWRRGPAGSQRACGSRRSLVNTGAPWPDQTVAEQRVLGMQTKLHRWAGRDPRRRFDDLFNLVAEPAFLVVAWNRGRQNGGASGAGVDGIAPRSVGPAAGVMLAALRDDLKARRFTPAPVREKAIPKASGKVRRLGIPTTADRVVQASLKLVLEPIFEADFAPASYGFRPRRRAQDAIAEIFYFASPPRSYEWVLEADIAACFDEIDHQALMDRGRRRVGDTRVLRLISAFLAVGVLTEEAVSRETVTGTPQGGILSPLLANIALSVLDEHFARKWEAVGPEWRRRKHRRGGGYLARLVRYADDFVVMVAGTRDDAASLRDEVAGALALIGLIFYFL